MKTNYSDDIFKYLNPNGNDKLSFYRGIDLHDLINLINNFSFPMRDSIGVPAKNTIGLEIECEYANSSLIFDELCKSWEMVPDGTLTDGVEINSPILTDEKKCWQELKMVCELLSKYSKIGENCSGHIHIGKQAYADDRDTILKFISLWTLYEPIILRFSNGEFLSSRPGLYEYACPVSYLWIYILHLSINNHLEKDEIIKELSTTRYYAVNFKSYYSLNTIEFRCPNGSFNPVIWQNNVNLFMKFLLALNRINVDYDLVLRKISEISHGRITDFNKIYLEDSLEFVDLIFDNNLDKIYFLKQYLKSLETSDRYEKAKSFC